MTCSARWAGAALAFLLSASPLASQDVIGTALGPDGEPLTDATVILHRVGAGGAGAMAGSDTTGLDGSFRFELPAGDEGVYFAALRFGQGIYIGPAIQAGGADVADYVLQVGPSSEVGAVGAALSNPGARQPARARPAQRTGRSSSDTGALWLVALLALAAAATFVLTAPRYRSRRTRDAVIEVAGIENRLADEAGALSGDEREELEARRDRLKEQLAPTG